MPRQPRWRSDSLAKNAIVKARAALVAYRRGEIGRARIFKTEALESINMAQEVAETAEEARYLNRARRLVWRLLHRVDVR